MSLLLYLGPSIKFAKCVAICAREPVHEVVEKVGPGLYRVALVA